MLLIDSINRHTSVKDYPFTTGDQLLSIDGRDVDLLLQEFAVYATRPNPRINTTPHAQRVSPSVRNRNAARRGCRRHSAKVVILRQSGATETYDIPWTVTGTPLTVGPVPSPKIARVPRMTARRQFAQAAPDYMTELLNAQWSGVMNPEELGLNGYGSLTPIFLGALGNAHFTRRLGGNASDFFYSGTFTYEDLTIGYIRIPTTPTSTAP